MSCAIGAVVLAAGLSRRMGQPKLLLPWGATTVIGQVVSVLQSVSVPVEMVVAAGKLRAEIETNLAGAAAQVVFNPDYESGEMISSLRVGLAALPAEVQAALVVLGDQPQIQPEIVEQVIFAYRQTGARLVVPSFQMRRGHPWLVDRVLWPELVDLSEQLTLRDFLQAHTDEIHYVPVDSPSVLKDLDTPEDYQAEKPR